MKQESQTQRGSNHMKKKILTMICVTVMVFALALPCFAESSTKIISTYTENLGNGISAVVTIEETTVQGRTAKTYSKSENYYSGGTYIGRAVLIATFSYNGLTSSATGASGSGIGSNGWSYGGQSTWTSGKSAYLSAALSNGGTNIGVSISLSCDANGNVK